MSKSYFAILEVTSSATATEVRSAYRRLVKAFHPDHYSGDSKPFRQIQEAYSVLGNPEKRRAYEKALVRVRRDVNPGPGHDAEPLVPEGGPVDMGDISPIRSFETYTPSFNEIFDWLWDNFDSIRPSKSSRVQSLTLEVTLTREQALRGGNARIMVPARSICPNCRGYGGIGYHECRRCAGEGIITGEVPVSIAFPPGLVKDHAVVIPLERFGIRNLRLTVFFRPRDVDDR